MKIIKLMQEKCLKPDSFLLIILAFPFGIVQMTQVERRQEMTTVYRNVVIKTRKRQHITMKEKKKKHNIGIILIYLLVI